MNKALAAAGAGLLAIGLVIGLAGTAPVDNSKLPPPDPQFTATVATIAPVDTSAALCAIVADDALVTSAGFAAMGFKSPDAYAFVTARLPADGGKVQYQPGDLVAGGAFQMPKAPPTLGPCGKGEPQIQVALQGTPGSAFKCACSTGPSCLQPDGGPALAGGNTLQPGTFVPGPACLPKVCGEIEGTPSSLAGCAP